jgi:hypothetical protein
MTMIRWRTLLVPLVAAAAAALLVLVGFWDASKQGLLVALSVVATGVLVRIARGLPFTTPDHYEVEEIRTLAKAVSRIIRALRALIFFVLAGMVSLVLAKPVLDFALAVPALQPLAGYAERAISAGLAFILTYVFVRMLQVVKGDQDLAELQSKFIVRAVERKQAKRFEEQQRAESAPVLKRPEGYGRVMQ